MPPQEVPVRERRTHLYTATPHHFPQLMGAIAASNYCVSQMHNSLQQANTSMLAYTSCLYPEWPGMSSSEGVLLRGQHAAKVAAACRARTIAISVRCRMSGMMRSTARHSTCERCSLSRSYSGDPRSMPGAIVTYHISMSTHSMLHTSCTRGKTQGRSSDAWCLFKMCSVIRNSSLPLHASGAP